jgi:hypothetical protein
MSYSSQLNPPDFSDAMPNFSVLGDMLVRIGTFKFRVVKIPGSDCGVFADMFHVESYASEEDANALCNRLIHQQARDHKRGI